MREVFSARQHEFISLDEHRKNNSKIKISKIKIIENKTRINKKNKKIRIIFHGGNEHGTGWEKK